MRLKEFEQLHIKQQKSTLTQADFCRKHGVALATFGYWKKKYLTSNTKVMARPFVDITPVQSLMSESFEYRFTNGASLKIPQQFDQNSLYKILQVLER
ncbi:MAG: hypothetical protein OCD01_11755 [Fibrobacterales bacterium]